MKIAAILHAYAPQELKAQTGASKAPAKGSGEAASASRKSTRDTVEISSEGKRRLAHIQSRIDAGYYNSSAVADDISDKLTKVLDELT